MLTNSEEGSLLQKKKYMAFVFYWDVFTKSILECLYLRIGRWKIDEKFDFSEVQI